MNILGTATLIRVQGRDTGGSVAVIETRDLPGGGPPPHIHHREDETCQILEGEYEFTVGSKTILATSGTTLFAPRDIAHTYRYVGKTLGRLMCVFTPAGFDEFFEGTGAMNPQQQQGISRLVESRRNSASNILRGPARERVQHHAFVA